MFNAPIFNKSNPSDDELRQCARQPDETCGFMCRCCPHTQRCTGLALKDFAKFMKEYKENNK